MAMDNDRLVDLVRNDEHYLKFKSPRDERVLEAMKQVKRRDFLGDERSGYTFINFEGVSMIQYIDEDIKKLTKDNMEQIAASMRENMDKLMVILAANLNYRLTAKDLAYINQVLPIGNKQHCSQPAMVAFMDDILELEEGMRVLEIGGGSGYSAAVTSHLIGDSGFFSYLTGKAGFLVTIEYIPELAEMTQKNLENHFGRRKLEKRLRVVHGDGSIGYQQEAPYDRIYLTAGVNLKSFNPDILARQLKPNGILLFPETEGDFIKQTYSNGKMVDEKRFGPVVFVPLKGQNT